MHVVAVINQKGGVAKTTTVANLGAGLALRGLRTLLIDLDPQANLTLGCGIEADGGRYRLPEVLADPETVPLAAAVRQIGELPFYIAPGHIDMARTEALLGRETDAVYRLRDAIDQMTRRYALDWILMDCPPSLGLLTQSAIVASNHLLVPSQPNMYAFAGMDTLNKMVTGLSATYQFRTELLGVLLTMYDKGTRLHRTIASVIHERFGDKVFDTIIYKNVRLSESEIAGKPAVLMDPNAKGSQEYLALVDEVLARTAVPTPGKSD
jgi:chromosome partitioning protein